MDESVYGYGVITDRKIIIDKKTRPMAIILERDDVDGMISLIGSCKSESYPNPIAHWALTCNAENCFQVLIDCDHPSLKDRSFLGK